MNIDLWSSIQAALDQSRFFVLMASTHAASSPWITREVEYWLRQHGPSSLFIILTEGAIRWDPAIGDFDKEDTDALPPCLFGRFTNEPLWADVSSVRVPVARGQRNDRLRDAARSLAAAIYGIRKDQIDSDDERESKRARRFLQGSVAGLTVLTVLSIVAALIAFTQTNRANAQLRVATSRAVAGEADDLGTREPALSARLAIAAYGLDPSTQTLATLMRAFDRNRHVVRYIERAPGTLNGIDPSTGYEAANGVAMSGDGKIVAVAGGVDANIRLWDAQSGAPIRNLHTTVSSDGNQPPRLTFTSNGRLIVQFQTGINVWDVASGSQLFSSELAELSAGGGILAVSNDGSRAAILAYQGQQSVAEIVQLTYPPRPAQIVGVGDSATLSAVSAVTGHSSTPSLDSIYPDPNKILEGAITDDGRYAAALLDNRLLETWDLTTRTRLATRVLPEDPGWVAVDISSDGSTVLAGNDNGEILRMDVTLTSVESLGGLPSGIHQVRFGSGSPDLAVALDEAGTVAIISPLKDRRVDTLPGLSGIVIDHNATPPNLLASNDGRWLAVEMDKSIQLWQVDEKRLVGEFPSRSSYLGTRSSFNADSTLFAVVTSQGVTIHQLPSGRVTKVVAAADPLDIARAIQNGVGGIQVLQDNNGRVHMISRTGDTIVGTPPASALDQTAQLRTSSFSAGIIMRDKNTGAPSELITYDLRGDVPREVGRINISDDISLEAVSDDGRYAALNDSIIDVTTGSRTPLSGGNGLYAQMGAVITADNTQLISQVGPTRYATGTIRNTMLLWNAREGNLIGQWPETVLMPLHQYPNQSTQVVRLRGHAATIRADGTIGIWEVEPSIWLRQLCDMAGDLNSTQRSQYLGSVEAENVCTPAPVAEAGTGTLFSTRMRTVWFAIALVASLLGFCLLIVDRAVRRRATRNHQPSR